MHGSAGSLDGLSHSLGALPQVTAHRLTQRGQAGTGDKSLISRYQLVGESRTGHVAHKQINEHLGPSMRFVADFSNWDQSLNNITVGESGQILSSHYKDQWEDYYNGRSYPMQFGAVQATSTLEFRPAAESPAP